MSDCQMSNTDNRTEKDLQFCKETEDREVQQQLLPPEVRWEIIIDDEETADPVTEISNKENRKQLNRNIKSVRIVTPAQYVIGILMVVLCGFLIATSALIFKLSTYSATQMTAIKGLGHFLLIVPLILYNKQSFSGESGERLFLLGRSALGGIAVMSTFLAYEKIPVADASTIIQSSTVLVTLIAWVVLREPCDIFLCVSVILAISGLVLVVKPEFIFDNSIMLEKYPDYMEGIVYAFGGMLSTTLVVIILRKMKNTHYTVTVLGMSVGIFMIGSILCIIRNDFKMPTAVLDGAYFVGISVSGVLTQMLLTKALQIVHAAPVTVFRTSAIVVNFLYQVTVFDEIPEWTSIAGALLIISGVLMTAIKTMYFKNYKQDE